MLKSPNLNTQNKGVCVYIMAEVRYRIQHPHKGGFWKKKSYPIKTLRNVWNLSIKYRAHIFCKEIYTYQTKLREGYAKTLEASA